MYLLILAGEEFRVKTPFRGSTEFWVNELLRANGYCNITYIERELAPVGSDGTNLTELEGLLNARRTVFTGSGCMSEVEIGKLISLMHDPEHETRKDAGKYNYQTTEKFLAIALKQLFALAQADLLERNGMETTLYLNTYPLGNGFYNTSSHNIDARRPTQ